MQMVCLQAAILTPLNKNYGKSRVFIPMNSAVFRQARCRTYPGWGDEGSGRRRALWDALGPENAKMLFLDWGIFCNKDFRKNRQGAIRSARTV